MAMIFLKNKSENYYKNHYLSDIYNKYTMLSDKKLDENKLEYFDDVFKVFKLSKQIKDPTKRKLILEKFYESWEKKDSLDIDRFESLLKFDRLSINVIDHFLNNEEYMAFRNLKLINLTIDKSIKINKLTEIIDFDQALLKLKYPSEISEMRPYKSKYKFEIIKTIKDAKSIAKHYHTCWHAYHSPDMIKGDFFLINVKKDDNLVGTIRFKKKEKLWNMAGWSNHIDGKEETKNWQISKKDLKDIALFMYKETRNEIFNIKNLELEYHLGKTRISKSLNKLHTESTSRKRTQKL